MRRTRTLRKRYAYHKPLRDAIAGWSGGSLALLQVSDMMQAHEWLLGGGHATSCYTISRLCSEIVVVTGAEVDLPAELKTGDPFPVSLRVVSCNDFDDFYRRGVDHVVRGKTFKIPCFEDLVSILRDGDYRDWGDLCRLQFAS